MPRVTKKIEDRKAKLAQVTTSDLLELSSQADIALRAAKTIEDKVKKHLTKIIVGTAVIRTTDHEKWKEYAKNNRQEIKSI